MKKTTPNFLWWVWWAVVLFLPQQAGAQIISSGQAIEDNAKPWQLGLTKGVSESAEQVAFFHDWVLMPLIAFICLFVLALLVIILFRFSEKRNPVPSKISHNTTLEIIWTAIPLLILGVMFIPSIKILYFVDGSAPSYMTVKAVGHQWYWSYEYSDLKNEIGEPVGDIQFDSLMLAEDSLPPGEEHLYRMKVDQPIYIPVNRRIKLIITSQDVLHSFSVLPLGLKMDAIPGRNNETWVTATKQGTYYGFCTELCGANHAFMPIEFRVVSDSAFQQWLAEKNPEEVVGGVAQK